MEPVRPITLPAPAPALDRPPRPVAPVAPVAAVDGSERQPLDPAVSVELSPDAASRTDRPTPDRRGFERDADTQTVVFRITDALSGDVIVQIPDEVLIKARAYGRQPEPPAGERVAMTA